MRKDKDQENHKHDPNHIVEDYENKFNWEEVKVILHPTESGFFDLSGKKQGTSKPWRLMKERNPNLRNIR